ncbi:hypothetical protein ACFL27_04725 [candidate division CSSED10-310 bacterium]|uniref:Uncharacterized protein n=1 Tax=candidate division CSSED10-310 bacterium TaxID=2855610 RepID=A0ABV6YTT7_UNCC1
MNSRSGIDAYFLASIFQDIESLKLYAGIHGIHYDNYNRFFREDFPPPFITVLKKTR